MRGSEFAELKAFAAVVERASFTRAAGHLGLSPSALSQKIRALEARIGLPLLTRTTRSVGLTQAGQIFLDRARPALAELSSAYDETRDLGQPAGLLRLHMPRGVIALLVEPILAGFCAAYPRIDIEVVAQDETVNLVEGGFDAGVQIGELLDADMIAFRLTGPIHFVVVGAPAYFERHGRPMQPGDLRQHNCARLRRGPTAIGNWYVVEGGKAHEMAVTGRLLTNDMALTIAAARQGVGLCYIPEAMVQPWLATGELEAVLTDFMPTSDGVFLYYPNRAQVLPKLRVFIDYVREHLFS